MEIVREGEFVAEAGFQVDNVDVVGVVGVEDAGRESKAGAVGGNSGIEEDWGEVKVGGESGHGGGERTGGFEIVERSDEDVGKKTEGSRANLGHFEGVEDDVLIVGPVGEVHGENAERVIGPPVE